MRTPSDPLARPASALQYSARSQPCVLRAPTDPRPASWPAGARRAFSPVAEPLNNGYARRGDQNLDQLTTEHSISIKMMMASLRRLTFGGVMTMNRAGRTSLVIQMSPRSTTAVEGAAIGLGEHDDRRPQTGNEEAGTAAGSGRCPFKLPINAAEEHGSVSSTDARPMHELGGPIGWPIVGNFLTYLKKENQGKMHEVQVSTVS